MPHADAVRVTENAAVRFAEKLGNKTKKAIANQKYARRCTPLPRPASVKPEYDKEQNAL
ncbi:MAG: hypothetical protein ACD_10C00732G0001 [uncultured bacterium]|nr:MAG: hypothetical protein ACD_10C00732G0001 [uncultured bacterium]